MGLLPVVLAVLLMQADPAPPAAPREPGPPAQDQPGQQPVRPNTAARSAGSEDLFSIDHIRKELERQPTLTFTMPDPNVPRYRVDIQGKRFELPSLEQRLATALPKSAVQVPFGGTERYDMMRLNTPPQYAGSAPFTNSDLLKMSALNGAYGLAGALLKKAIQARESAAEERARQEVLQELAEVAAHNARVAAGNPDPDGAAAGKKKQDERKKPTAKKKKDDRRKDEGAGP